MLCHYGWYFVAGPSTHNLKKEYREHFSFSTLVLQVALVAFAANERHSSLLLAELKTICPHLSSSWWPMQEAQHNKISVRAGNKSCLMLHLLLLQIYVLSRHICANLTPIT